ncbi:MAG: CBASS cGAMP synthase [Pseudomonadota bacterium]
MEPVINYHALFQNPTEKAFVHRLALDAKTERVLKDASTKVQNTLRPLLKQLAEKNGLQWPLTEPQFRPQGSSVYKTQNAPAHTPEQQVDMDLGVYIAAAFFEATITLDSARGAVRRSLPAGALAKAYFALVDKALRGLCNVEGWRYAEGEAKKDTCCRIDLTSEGVHAHIDVPLYAAPNEQFERAALMFRRMTMDSVQFTAAKADLSSELDRDGWDELKVVVMATRDGEWNESDVQVTIKHFKDAMNDSGHPFVLRKLWRYVKAWRDQNWKDGGGPSSILIMEAVNRILDPTQKEIRDLLGSGREDILLQFIFERLPAQLSVPVIVHWGREPEDLNRGTSDAKAQWRELARQCGANLTRAGGDAQLTAGQVISLVLERFGARIPRDESLIKIARAAVPFLAATPKSHPDPQQRIHRTTGA